MERSAWARSAETLDFAFQPIVDARSRRCIGYEALVRGFGTLGFRDPFGLFDAASEDGALYVLDLALRKRAVEKFVSIPHHHGLTLFYNLDNRLLDMPDYSAGNTREMLAEAGLEPFDLCFEVSERHEMKSHERVTRLLTAYAGQGFRIALDDFGSGFSSLQLLHTCEPEFVKLDRFFVAGIATDLRRRRFVRHLVDAIHGLGIAVIAEGVETTAEVDVFAAMGCDALQGFEIQRPTVDVSDLRSDYEPPSRREDGISRPVHTLLTVVSPSAASSRIR